MRWRWRCGDAARIQLIAVAMGHLTGAIEQFLRELPVKYLGDAWMLAQALAEGHPLHGWR